MILRGLVGVGALVSVAVVGTPGALERSRGLGEGPRPSATTLLEPGRAPSGSGRDAPRRFGREALSGPLPFFYDLYTFRGETPGETTVVAAFAVPVDELRRESRDGTAQYRFDVSLVLSDTARQSVVRSDDSVFVRAPRKLPGDHLLHTFVEIRVPPTPHTWQRVIMTDATTPGVGQLYRSPFPIPDYGGTELMLSDIALGLPDAVGGWPRRSVSLALLPTSQFPESAFNLYYEVYNLPAGHAYETEIAIVPLDGSGREDEDRDAPVRARFDERSTAGDDDTLGELRRIQSALPEGRYRLLVTVTDRESRQTASSSRDFEVRGGRGGATMVPALPRRTQTIGPRPGS